MSFSSLRCFVLAAAGLLSAAVWAAPAPRVQDPVAHGLIVGYRDGVNPLRHEETDRAPWADRRTREAAAWVRASQRSRERTERLAKDTGLKPDAVAEAGRAAVMRFRRPMRGTELGDAVRRLRLHPDVAWVEPDVLVPRQATPNDPSFGAQWHLRGPSDPTLPEATGVNMPLAWDLSTGAAGGVVAVVDSGVRYDHSDLAGKLLAGYDFVSELQIANDGDGRDGDATDPGDWVSPTDRNSPLFSACEVEPSSWHGTFIAGQIAAASNNGVGIAGVNWQAKVLPVRVSGKCGALVSDLLDGVRWAAGLPVAGVPANPTPAKVINLSFGGDSACSAAYQATVDDVRDAGALLVVAAGNLAAPLRRPADCQGVMAIGAVTRSGAKADYASFGANVALSTPGGSGATPVDPDNLFSTAFDSANGGFGPGVSESYVYKRGTSFAAPQAAGVASLMLALNPSLTPGGLIERMQRGARPHLAIGLAACGPGNPGVCQCTTDTCGVGLLDARTALQLATGPAAIVRKVGTVAPGSAITLDGLASVAPTGANITAYQWTLVSGPRALDIPGAAQAQTSVQLPPVVGRWVFRLQVTDNTGATGSDTVLVRAEGAVEPAPARSGGGSFGGAWLALALAGLALLRRRA